MLEKLNYIQINVTSNITFSLIKVSAPLTLRFAELQRRTSNDEEIK